MRMNERMSSSWVERRQMVGVGKFFFKKNKIYFDN